MFWFIIFILSILIYFILVSGKQQNKKVNNSHSYDDVIVENSLASQPTKSDYDQNRIDEILDEYHKGLDEKFAKAHSGFPYIEFDIAGLYYRTKAAKEHLKLMDIYTQVSLVKEPTNSYDSNAVKLYNDRFFLGYVPRIYSEYVTTWINQKKIVFVRIMEMEIHEFIDEYSCYIRIYYDDVKEKQKQFDNDMKAQLTTEYQIKQLSTVDIIEPTWMQTALELANTVKVSDEYGMQFNRLRTNIKNSYRAFQKASEDHKELIADNAKNRMQKYWKELEELLEKDKK